MMKILSKRATLLQEQLGGPSSVEITLPIAEVLCDLRYGSLFLSVVMRLISVFIFFLSFLLVLSFITMILDEKE